MEHSRQDCVCGNQWGGREECGESGSSVADRLGDGSVEDNCTKCQWGRSDEFCFLLVVMGAPFPLLEVGAVLVNVVNGENKTHAFVGWLSGHKNCFNGVELVDVVSEWGPIVGQDNGQR